MMSSDLGNRGPGSLKVQLECFRSPACPEKSELCSLPIISLEHIRAILWVREEKEILLQLAWCGREIILVL